MEVNHNKIARTARVVLERNSKGVKVRLHYTYSPVAGYGEAVVCFEREAVNGKIKKASGRKLWKLRMKSHAVTGYRLILTEGSMRNVK